MAFFNSINMERYYNLTEEEMDQIHKMFFGPYKKKWMVDGIVDNSTSTISKRLGLNYNSVSFYIDAELNKLIKQVQDENNHKSKS